MHMERSLAVAVNLWWPLKAQPKTLQTGQIFQKFDKSLFFLIDRNGHILKVRKNRGLLICLISFNVSVLLLLFTEDIISVISFI